MDLYKVSWSNSKKDLLGRAKTNSSTWYIHELAEPFDKLELQFIPETLQWNRTGNWVDVPIPGRNNSRHHLTGGEDNVDMRFDFNGMFESDPDMCAKKLSWLQSLTMTDGFNSPGRRVKIVAGTSDIFRFKVWIVKSVSGALSMFHSGKGLNPQQLYVDVSFEQDPEMNTRIADVRLIDYNSQYNTIEE